MPARNRLSRALRRAHSAPTKNAASTAPTGEFRALDIPRLDWQRLAHLPWDVPLDEWSPQLVTMLSVRKGESRHPVLFMEVDRHRYAIKETSPLAATHEITAFRALQERDCCTLDPVGYVILRGEPIPAGMVAGQMVYESGDIGYCITRLAERVLPQSILYRYPFTESNKRLLWNAIAELLLDLHERGVYWGDPSLANVLIDMSYHRLTAIMADAETAEVKSGALDEGLRQQDLEMFVESLRWQAEDIRLARDLPEDQQLVTENDGAYVLSRYAGLRAERAAASSYGPLTDNVLGYIGDITQRMQRLNTLGYGVVHLGAQYARFGLNEIESLALPYLRKPNPTDVATAEEYGMRVATLRPGWYVRRLRDLLGVRIPPEPARRIYQAISVHKWLLSEQAGHDVGMETTIHDWQQNYHQPLLALLTARYPHADAATSYETYAAVLQHTWQLSQRQGRAIPLEEGALDYLLTHQERP